MIPVAALAAKRRASGVNGGAAAPTLYSQQITNTANDGREYTGAWLPNSPTTVFDLGGAGDGIYAGLTFDTVNVTGTVSSAILDLVITAEAAPGTWTLYAESNAAAASAVWSGTHLPNAATPVATNIPGNSTAVGTYSIPVTTLVNEVMAGANWAAGQRINFFMKAPVGSYASCTFASAPAGNAPTLVLL